MGDRDAHEETAQLMQSEEIYAELTPIFHDLFDDETLVLTPGLSAGDVPEWDSFNHINLIVAVESTFQIKFQTAELESLQSVAQLVGLISKKLAAQGR
jgi:acyl carrier protein